MMTIHEPARAAVLRLAWGLLATALLLPGAPARAHTDSQFKWWSGNALKTTVTASMTSGDQTVTTPTAVTVTGSHTGALHLDTNQQTVGGAIVTVTGAITTPDGTVLSTDNFTLTVSRSAPNDSDSTTTSHMYFLQIAATVCHKAQTWSPTDQNEEVRASDTHCVVGQ